MPRLSFKFPAVFKVRVFEDEAVRLERFLDCEGDEFLHRYYKKIQEPPQKYLHCESHYHKGMLGNSNSKRPTIIYYTQQGTISSEEYYENNRRIRIVEYKKDGTPFRILNFYKDSLQPEVFYI